MDNSRVIEPNFDLPESDKVTQSPVCDRTYAERTSVRTLRETIPNEPASRCSRFRSCSSSTDSHASQAFQ